jgi:hypothetical protein
MTSSTAQAHPEVLPSLDSSLGVILNAAKAYAFEHFAGIKVINESDGSEIEIARSGIKHALSAGAGKLDALAATDLATLIQTAKHRISEPDKLRRPEIKAVHKYVSQLQTNEVKCEVGIVVREFVDGRKYYDHFAWRAKSATPLGISDEASSGVSDGLLGQPASGDGASINKFGNNKL